MTTATPIYMQTPKNVAAKIQASDNLTKVTLVSAAAAMKISSLSASSTDGTNRNVQLYLTVGGVDYLISTVVVSGDSGNTISQPPVNLLSNSQLPGLSFDALGNRVYVLEAAAALKASVTTTVSASREVGFTGYGGIY